MVFLMMKIKRIMWEMGLMIDKVNFIKITIDLDEFSDQLVEKLYNEGKRTFQLCSIERILQINNFKTDLTTALTFFLKHETI